MNRETIKKFEDLKGFRSSRKENKRAKIKKQKLWKRGCRGFFDTPSPLRGVLPLKKVGELGFFDLFKD